MSTTIDTLDYSVETIPLLTPDGQASGWLGNRRTDTKQVLGVCTERYSLVQNKPLIETVENAFADNGLGNFDRKSYVMRDGARVYVQYDFKNQLTKLPKVGDDIGMRLTLHNSFDRSCRVSFEMGMLRLVCTNGMKTLGDEYSITQKHSDNLDMAKLVDVIKGSIQGFNKGTEVFARLAERSIGNDEGNVILDNLTKRKVIAERNVDKIKILWNGPKRPEDKARNLWNLYNAITEFTTHQIEPTSYELAARINKGSLHALNRATLIPGEFNKLTALNN
jgi:Domain of unknown function (DUF932)